MTWVQALAPVFASLLVLFAMLVMKCIERWLVPPRDEWWDSGVVVTVMVAVFMVTILGPGVWLIMRLSGSR